MSVAATFKITFAAISWSILHESLYSPLADLEGRSAPAPFGRRTDVRGH